MDKNNWFSEQIANDKATEQDYFNRALLTYLDFYLKEINQRIEQKNHQIDGELWNHEEW